MKGFAMAISIFLTLRVKFFLPKRGTNYYLRGIRLQLQKRLRQNKM